MKWYIEAITNYVNFKGRARRKAYWMFVLFNVIIMVLLSLLDAAFDISVGYSNMGLIYFIYTLFILLPSISVSVRRLHDTGRSGWWYLINFVPFVGGIIFIVFMCLDSYYGENQYGPCPKQVIDVDIPFSGNENENQENAGE